MCDFGSFVAVGLKGLCFIALRLEDEPLSEMSVELEGTAKCLPCSASLVWTISVLLLLISVIIFVVCSNAKSSNAKTINLTLSLLLPNLPFPCCLPLESPSA